MGGCSSTPVNSTDLYPIASPVYLCTLKVFVGLTCALSIIGALLIIADYICEESRSAASFRLVCVSVADILVAWAHLWGVSSHWERFLDPYRPANSSEDIYLDPQCVAQASLAVYGTLASFLWTIALAWFVFFSLCCTYKYCVPSTNLCTFLAHLFCWGVPLAVVTWLGASSNLGFSRGISVAWCYNHLHQTGKVEQQLVVLFSYDLWSYATFSLLLFFAFGTCCALNCRLFSQKAVYAKLEDQDTVVTPERRQRPQENEEIASGEERLSTFDKRLISVAVTLLILRLPSLIIDIAVLATPSEQVPEIFHTTAMAAGVFLAGIGDSAQGAANAIIFLVIRRVKIRTVE